MATSTALMTTESTALTAPVSALPTCNEMLQRMAWMAEMRPVLLEYVQRHMDPARHMYTFDNNSYTPLTLDRLTAMMQKGQKPALNQDGIHNLMSLYECYPDEPSVVETREGGHYACRATVRLISHRTGQPMGAGTGSCSSRESKYAYRWVGERDVPRGVDKTSLRQRTGQSQYGDRQQYTRYRLENEDIGDIENTVLKMAIKRAKSSAVQALPLVSELFAVGDPDEDDQARDAERQEILRPFGVWLRGLPRGSGPKALQAIFGEPLTAKDLQTLDSERLTVGWQLVELAERQQVKWESPTLGADLKAARARSAQAAREDLYGDSQPARVGGEVIDTVTGEVVDVPEPDQDTLL